MLGSTFVRCLIVGILFSLSSACSLSSDSSFSKISIRMAGESPAAKLLEPLTRAFMPPSTTASFDCLGVNVMGIGIVPTINCNCTGNNCSCGTDQLLAYANLPQNIAGQTYCGYPGVTSGAVVNDTAPKSIKLVVPSGPKRIIEMVGVVDPASEVCNKIGPLGQVHSDNANFFEVGRAVVDLFGSQSVAIPDTFTDLSSNPTEQAKRQINCGGNTPSSYIAYIPTESGLFVYFPLFEPAASPYATPLGTYSSYFGNLSYAGAPAAAPGAVGPLLQSADSSSNYALSLPGNVSAAMGTVTAAFGLDQLSVEAWVKISGNCASNGFGKIFELTNGNQKVQLHCLSTNTVGFAVTDPSLNFAFTDSSVTINDGSWHHVVATWAQVASTTPKLYIDGIERTTGGTPGTVNTLPFAAGSSVATSGSSNGLPAGSFVSHIALYNQALTQSQIQKHYRASGR